MLLLLLLLFFNKTFDNDVAAISIDGHNGNSIFYLFPNVELRLTADTVAVAVAVAVVFWPFDDNDNDSDADVDVGRLPSLAVCYLITTMMMSQVSIWKIELMFVVTVIE